MEFFVPGLLIFILAIGLTFVIAPRVTPLIAAVLSIVFLVYGVYSHYKMFASEYRLSTWQDSLLQYSPAVMIFGIILFIIYYIFVFFTQGEVPVPKINVPSFTNVTETISNTINNASNSIANTLNFNTPANAKNNSNKGLLNGILNTNKANNSKNASTGLFGQTNQNKNQKPPSLFETI
jgi:hypothetical protein